jgi:hypothetical protein
MNGPPNDVDGECNARLFLGDDYGDNSCTFRCTAKPGHDGAHIETSGLPKNPVTVMWQLDQRFSCDKHGLRSEYYCSDCDAEQIIEEAKS